MTPAQLAKSGTERAVFAWAAYAMQHGFEAARSWIETGSRWDGVPPETPAVPELKWLHHIPNGGARGDDAKTRAIRGNALKAEGVRTGVSDLCLPVKRGDCSGLYIEMKKPGGKESAEQKEFGKFVRSQGFAYVCCDCWQHAVDIIEQYLKAQP